MFENLSPEDYHKLLPNPFYCLPEIDPIFVELHEPLITEEMWIAANVKVIEEIGSEKWLFLLLENLKGNYVRSVNPEDN